MAAIILNRSRGPLGEVFSLFKFRRELTSTPCCSWKTDKKAIPEPPGNSRAAPALQHPDPFPQRSGATAEAAASGDEREPQALAQAGVQQAGQGVLANALYSFKRQLSPSQCSQTACAFQLISQNCTPRGTEQSPLQPWQPHGGAKQGSQAAPGPAGAASRCPPHTPAVSTAALLPWRTIFKSLPLFWHEFPKSFLL